MNILVYAEHDNAILSSQTAKAVTAAEKIGGEIHILVAGKDCAPVAEQAAALNGAGKIIRVDDDVYANQLAEPISALIVSLADHYETIMAAATANGRTILPRVAALLDVMQVSDVSRIIAPDTFERSTYAGNAVQTVQSSDKKRILTIRTTNFSAAGIGGAAPIEVVEPIGVSDMSQFVTAAIEASDRPELTSAKVVVAGGRALGSAEKFNELVIPLAEKLGAAVGASRAAVDAGYAPNDWQVGQTGKVVAPELYIAVGISGAIQHLAGMKDSKIIVAINKDEDAPIFQVADYALVADLFEAVPELSAAV